MTAIVPSRDPTFCATLVLNQPGKDAVSWPERKPCNGGVMTLEVWQRSVSGHLVILLDAVRQELAHDPINFSGWFERVLPWGMDDGEGLVRLTVLKERTSPFDPRQFRVVLDAKAKAFVFGHETVLDVSRFAKLLEAICTASGTEWCSMLSRTPQPDGSLSSSGPGTVEGRSAVSRMAL
jgi:hypothetical protein